MKSSEMKERQQVAKIWDKFWNLDFENLKLSPYIEYFFNSHIAIINKWINLEGKRVLEVGVGQGILLSKLAIINKAIPYGVDISRNACIISRKRFNKLGIKGFIIRGDAFCLPFKSNSFDCVICLGLIEHFESQKSRELIIKELKRVTTKGGCVILSVPKKWSLYTPKKYLDKLFNKWKFGYEKEYTLKEFRKLGEKFFKNIEIYGVDIHPSLLRLLPSKGPIRWFDKNLLIPALEKFQERYPKLVLKLAHLICLKGEVE